MLFTTSLNRLTKKQEAIIQVLVDFERTKYLYSGLGQFSLFLAQEMASLDSEQIQLNYLLPNSLDTSITESLLQKVAIEKLSLKRKFLPQFCRSYDLWHSTHQDSSYFPKNESDKYILTIHDLNFLEEKSEEKVAKRLKNLQKKVNRASHITVISEYTKKQIADHLDLAGKEVDVIYNGFSIDETKPPQKPKNIKWESNYLLYLGVVRKKKNVISLLPMLEALPDENLIIAGGQDASYMAELKKVISELRIEGRVQFLGEVNSQEKNWLYQNCKAFLFPSLLEGFGIPPIEAMHFARPCFISNRTSLPEVAGDAAVIWQDFDSKNMAETFCQGMQDFSNDPVTYKEKLQKQASRFSWQKAAREYFEIYKSFLKT